MRFFILSILASTLIFSSCTRDLNGDLVFGSDEDILGPRLFSSKLLTPALESTPLTSLIDGNGNSMQIEQEDMLTIRFYTNEYQTCHDTTIPCPGTVGDLLTQVADFATAEKVTITLAIDSTGSGLIRVKACSGGIQNLLIENVTNPISMAIMRGVFTWPNGVSVGSQTYGLCLTLADNSSPILTLKDSSGLSMGLEIGDSVSVNGEIPGGKIAMENNGFRIDTTNQTMDVILQLLEAAVPDSKPKFGNPTAKRDAGRVTLDMEESESALYYVTLTATNHDIDSIAPLTFNHTFKFGR